MAEDGSDEQIAQFKAAFDNGGWLKVVVLANAIRDAREKLLVDRVEKWLEQVIRDTHRENPSITVRDVRARLFDTPQ